MVWETSTNEWMYANAIKVKTSEADQPLPGQPAAGPESQLLMHFECFEALNQQDLSDLKAPEATAATAASPEQPRESSLP